jgi:hypothetical protein
VNDSFDAQAIVGAQIRNLLSAYNYFGDRSMTDKLAELFAPDGVLETSGSGSLVGRDAIANYLTERHKTRKTIDEGVAYTRHHLATTYVFDVQPQRASAHSYFQVLTKSGIDHWGSYDDQLALSDGTWVIAHRRVSVDGHSATSWRPHAADAASQH